MPPKKSASAAAGAQTAARVAGAQTVWLEDCVLVNPAKGPGIVTRVWSDPEEADDPLLEPLPKTGPDRQLKEGEIEVSYGDGAHEIVYQRTASIVDRAFIVGDLARLIKATDESEVGVVVDVQTEVQLEGIFSHQRLSAWIPATEVLNAVRIGRGDHVVAGDWLGVVEEVFSEAMVSTSREGPYKICDASSDLLVIGTNAAAVLAERPILLGGRPHQHRHNDFKTVLEAEQTVLACNWFAISQALDPSQHDSRPRPKRYWTSDSRDIRLVRAVADQLHYVADRVIFRDEAALARYGALPSQGAGVAQAFIVTRSRSTVTMLWFDGRRTTHPAVELEPTAHLDDEHDVWAGDLAVFSASDSPETRLAVVQRADPRQRTVDVRWYGTDQTETVSALELDPHGPPPEAFGVRRGDVVLLSREARSNFTATPTVPRIGQTEIDFPTEDALRGELSAIGLARASGQAGVTPNPHLTTSAATDIDWYGEVRDLGLDGTATVALPGNRLIQTTVDRLIIFDDGFDAELDWAGEDGLEDGDAEMDGASDASWETEDDNGPDEWADEEDDEVPAPVRSLSTSPLPPSALPAPMQVDAPNGSTDATLAPPPAPAPAVGTDDGPWQRFEMMESAPADHHYIRNPIEAPSKAFSQRVQKEYRVLEESLPDNILVRAYEDRIDLLRCLIIGPSNTPYEDAPFLFDIFLPPSRYPQEPPHVFFHSFSGSTRVSPNLYVEGKVCLSVLGTWAGERTESWNPSRSSVFQVLVSIQGLVLVREPWYLEPGFEKQRGTAEAALASDLYSERTYVLARGFIRRALEGPPFAGGLQDPIAHFYFGPAKRLQLVVDQARDVVRRSEAEPTPDATEREKEREKAGGIVQLTKGSVIPLKRTLVNLERLLEAGKPAWS